MTVQLLDRCGAGSPSREKPRSGNESWWWEETAR
jgi:hypothetical protein